ncbi:hypothetical protein P167DRAFT_377234 [Morchella conica CCBAS932]|uniref:Uncharacterized protein n=1 Tax=Morchella conica CCBAS932 TaxID=1392247 RepID=A0A3N4L275_9PEZI|nr:hypothetical protein P167DRAFT_377234 [Morchella conica CCBAS932]
MHRYSCGALSIGSPTNSPIGCARLLSKDFNSVSSGKTHMFLLMHVFNNRKHRCCWSGGQLTLTLLFLCWIHVSFSSVCSRVLYLSRVPATFIPADGEIGSLLDVISSLDKGRESLYLHLQ